MSRSTFSDSDLAYMRSLSGAVVQRTPRFMIIMLMLLAFVFISMLGWMGIAEIDVVVRGNGKVIPSRQLQVIQSLEGGVVSEILVKEGDLVEITQPLIKNQRHRVLELSGRKPFELSGATRAYLAIVG